MPLLGSAAQAQELSTQPRTPIMTFSPPTPPDSSSATEILSATKPDTFSLMDQGKYAEADPLYARSLAIQEKVLGPEHPAFATMLNNRAELLRKQVRTFLCNTSQTNRVVVVTLEILEDIPYSMHRLYAYLPHDTLSNVFRRTSCAAYDR